MALIVVLGVMNGLRDDLRDRILVANPHLRSSPIGTGAPARRLAAALDDQVRAEPGVVAAAPEVMTPVADLGRRTTMPRGCTSSASIRTPARAAVTLPAAADHARATSRSATTQHDVDGGIVLGHRLADRLSAFPGDVVTLVPPDAAPRSTRRSASCVPRFWQLRGDRALRHRDVPVRQPVRRDVAGRRRSGSPGWATR